MATVTAWTKNGDQVEPPGEWAVFQLMPHRGMLEQLPKVQKFKDVERATRYYQEKSRTHRKGGLFLVTPEGVVAACIWILPQLS
jgi:hypothetical protein